MMLCGYLAFIKSGGLVWQTTKPALERVDFLVSDTSSCL